MKVSIGPLGPVCVPGKHSSSRACEASVDSSWTSRARLPLALMESVSAIEKHLEVTCGERAATSQMVLIWPDHAGEVLEMSWLRMAFLTSAVI